MSEKNYNDVFVTTPSVSAPTSVVVSPAASVPTQLSARSFHSVTQKPAERATNNAVQQCQKNDMSDNTLSEEELQTVTNSPFVQVLKGESLETSNAHYDNIMHFSTKPLPKESEEEEESETLRQQELLVSEGVVEQQLRAAVNSAMAAAKQDKKLSFQSVIDSSAYLTALKLRGTHIDEELAYAKAFGARLSLTNPDVVGPLNSQPSQFVVVWPPKFVPLQEKERAISGKKLYNEPEYFGLLYAVQHKSLRLFKWQGRIGDIPVATMETEQEQQGDDDTDAATAHAGVFFPTRIKLMNVRQANQHYAELITSPELHDVRVGLMKSKGKVCNAVFELPVPPNENGDGLFLTLHGSLVPDKMFDSIEAADKDAVAAGVSGVVAPKGNKASRSTVSAEKSASRTVGDKKDDTFSIASQEMAHKKAASALASGEQDNTVQEETPSKKVAAQDTNKEVRPKRSRDVDAEPPAPSTKVARPTPVVTKKAADTESVVPKKKKKAKADDATAGASPSATSGAEALLQAVQPLLELDTTFADTKEHHKKLGLKQKPTLQSFISGAQFVHHRYGHVEDFWKEIQKKSFGDLAGTRVEVNGQPPVKPHRERVSAISAFVYTYLLPIIEDVQRAEKSLKKGK